LRDADDETASLVVETDDNQSPDSVETPEEVDGILSNCFPFRHVMVGLLHGMAGLLHQFTVVRGTGDRHVVSSLDISAGHVGVKLLFLLRLVGDAGLRDELQFSGEETCLCLYGFRITQIAAPTPHEARLETLSSRYTPNGRAPDLARKVAKPHCRGRLLDRSLI